MTKNEFKEVEVGDILKSKEEGMFYLVTAKTEDKIITFSYDNIESLIDFEHFSIEEATHFAMEKTDSDAKEALKALEQISNFSFALAQALRIHVKRKKKR